MSLMFLHINLILLYCKHHSPNIDTSGRIASIITIYGRISVCHNLLFTDAKYEDRGELKLLSIPETALLNLA